MIPLTHTPVTFILLDTRTGQRKEVVKEYGFRWWDDKGYGQGTCDCWRELAFGIYTPIPISQCRGSERFLVVGCSDPSRSLKDLNQGYPSALLKAHGIDTSP